MNEFFGSCHCGSVQFKFCAGEILEDLYECNCSLCLKKSILMKPISIEEFTLLSGEENISVYQWNKNIAKHFFCRTCGVYTHHIRRRDPNQISVNIMCVDDILIPRDIKINQVDGASHD